MPCILFISVRDNRQGQVASVKPAGYSGNSRSLLKVSVPISEEEAKAKYLKTAVPDELNQAFEDAQEAFMAAARAWSADKSQKNKEAFDAAQAAKLEAFDAADPRKFLRRTHTIDLAALPSEAVDYYRNLKTARNAREAASIEERQTRVAAVMATTLNRELTTEELTKDPKEWRDEQTALALKAIREGQDPIPFRITTDAIDAVHIDIDREIFEEEKAKVGAPPEVNLDMAALEAATIQHG